MGSFASMIEFVNMGGHGLYVWLSYALTLLIIIYNVSAVALKKRRFFVDAKRRLRRKNRSL